MGKILANEFARYREDQARLGQWIEWVEEIGKGQAWLTYRRFRENLALPRNNSLSRTANCGAHKPKPSQKSLDRALSKVYKLGLPKSLHCLGQKEVF